MGADFNPADEAERLREQLAEQDDAELPEEGVIEERLNILVNDYSVPLKEARRSVFREYGDENDESTPGTGGGGSTQVSVDDITAPDEWVTLEVQLAQLWDSTHDSIRQSGLIGDDTGRIKFVSWEQSDLELLEEGASYRIENAVTDEYQGRLSVNFNSSTVIEQIDEDIEAHEETEELYGAMVAVQDGSGLIKRCPIDGCTRVLSDGRCPEHGAVDGGEHDLRIKAVLDDGNDVQEVIFNREATEDIMDFDLDDAKEMAQEALDPTVVEQKVRDELVGKYYTVEGPKAGRYILVNEWGHLGLPDMEMVDGLLDRARTESETEPAEADD